jgi:hypothetical protein
MAWQQQWQKHPAVRSGDRPSLGERAADRMRNGMGSWPFVSTFEALTKEVHEIICSGPGQPRRAAPT